MLPGNRWASPSGRIPQDAPMESELGKLDEKPWSRRFSTTMEVNNEMRWSIMNKIHDLQHTQWSGDQIIGYTSLMLKLERWQPLLLKLSLSILLQKIFWKNTFWYIKCFNKYTVSLLNIEPVMVHSIRIQRLDFPIFQKVSWVSAHKLGTTTLRLKFNMAALSCYTVY